MIAGLIIAGLLANPLSLLPGFFGNVMPFVGVVFFGYLGVAIFTTRQNDLIGVSRASSAAREHRQLDLESRLSVLTSAPSCWIPVSSLTAGSQILPVQGSFPARCSFRALS